MHDEKKIEEIEEKYCMQIHDGTQDVMFPEQYRLAMREYAECYHKQQTLDDVYNYESRKYDGEIWIREVDHRNLIAIEREHHAKQVRKEVIEVVERGRLPYAYKSKSPFPGEAVDYHLKMHGHLPAVGCCKYDQMTDEETDIYNKAIEDIIKALNELE